MLQFIPIGKELQVNQPSDFYNLSEDKQKELLNWIRENLKQVKGFNVWNSSYGLKHLFETPTSGFYTTNGAFKGAMLEAGFRVKDTSQLNWHFNVSRKSVKDLYKLDEERRAQATARMGQRYLGRTLG